MATVAAGAGLILAVLAVFLIYGKPEKAAAELVATCSHHEKGPMWCYEQEVPKLYPDRSIPEIFNVIREIRRSDNNFQFCHVLSHKLGELVVAENPSNWLDAVALNPSDGLCSNGFIHGVIVGRFRNDVLDEKTLEAAIPDLARACEPRPNWVPSSLDQAICYHGMGHLLMFVTNADMRRSLDVCNRIGVSNTGNFLRVCREGVFMQIYQPLEPDDFALLENLAEVPSADTYRRFCAAYAIDEEEGACLREAWPLFREEILQGDGVARFCSRQPNDMEQNACYESATTIIGRQLLGHEEQAGNACNNLPVERQLTCFVSTAQAFLEEDRTQGERALSLCARASKKIADECTATLVGRAEFIFTRDSPERRNFCDLVSARTAFKCS